MDDIALLQRSLNETNIIQKKEQEELRKSLDQTHKEDINYERSRILALQTTVTSLTSFLQKPASSTEAGQIGEEMIENWTRELFNSVDIKVTTKESHAADLHVRLNNRILLFEVKNTLTVTKKDVDKFIRDIETNTNTINGGLFISLASPTIPNKGDFTLEYIGEIPVIYLYAPDKASLKIAVKTLLHLNSKEDSGMLTMLINQIYTSIKTMSGYTVSVSKNLDDAKSNLEISKREIRDSLQVLDNLFSENPELKIEKSSVSLEYTPEEIKTIREVYVTNKKARIADYVSALEVNAKYLQDRGGLAKIKTIINTQFITPTNIKFDPLLSLKL